MFCCVVPAGGRCADFLFCKVKQEEKMEQYAQGHTQGTENELVTGKIPQHKGVVER